MERNLVKKITLVAFLTFALVLNSNVAGAYVPTKNLTKYQESTVKKVFSAIASSNVGKIENARKLTVVNSNADLFLKLVYNHHTTSEIFKSTDGYGNVSPRVQDLPGKYKYSKNSVTLDANYNLIDGIYSNFKFTKSGKLISWSVKSGTSENLNLNENIYTFNSAYNNLGVKVPGGIIYSSPSGSTVFQLEYVNEHSGFKSWSYTTGHYRAADGNAYLISTEPYGCVKSGVTVYLEATTSTKPVLAAKTTSVVVAPTYTGCAGGSLATSSIPITLN
jgi:hypothetical protein